MGPAGQRLDVAEDTWCILSFSGYVLSNPIYCLTFRVKTRVSVRVSHAELLFGRKIRTKIPHLQEFLCEDEVRDRDSERKEKGKMYVDCKRHACENTFRKVTKCYSGRRETISCQHHSNKYLLQLFRKMETALPTIPVTTIQRDLREMPFFAFLLLVTAGSYRREARYRICFLYLLKFGPYQNR